MNHFPRALENIFSSAHTRRGKELFETGACINFDFVRNTFIAQITDNSSIYSVMVKKKQYKDNFTFSCDCPTYMRNMICPHLATLLFMIFSHYDNPQSIYENISKRYYESFWELLAKLCYETYLNQDLIFRLRNEKQSKDVFIDCYSDTDNKIFTHLITPSFSKKFLNKYKYIIFDEEEALIDYIVKRDAIAGSNSYDLPYHEKTELEERMNLAGYKSWLQKFEESIWFDLSKIWFLNIPCSSIKVAYDNNANQMTIKSNSLNFEFHLQKKQISEIIDAFHNRPDLKNIQDQSGQSVGQNGPNHSLGNGG